MSVNDNNRNGSRGFPIQLDESPERGVAQGSTTTESTDSEVAEPQVAKPQIREEPSVVPASDFATRASAEAKEGIGKNKLILLGGALAIAVLFFVFTAIIGKSPRKPTAAMQPVQQTKQDATKPAKGSLTPVMETVRTPAPDNANGQLGPGDIRRTRSSGRTLNWPRTKGVRHRRKVAL
jgi:hypothetical protein